MNDFELSPEDYRFLREAADARTEEANVQNRSSSDEPTGQREPRLAISPAGFARSPLRYGPVDSSWSKSSSPASAQFHDHGPIPTDPWDPSRRRESAVASLAAAF